MGKTPGLEYKDNTEFKSKISTNLNINNIVKQ